MDQYSIEKEWRIIEIKADLLCLGLRLNHVARNIYQHQNPSDDWKTGNVGLHLLLGGRTHVLATVAHEFDGNSPYSLGYEDGNLVLLRNSQFVCSAHAVVMPKWYHLKTSKNTPLSKVFLHEGRSFLHQTYAGCDYHVGANGCKFCGTGGTWDIAEPSDIGEAIAQALSENPEYHVCLGGGTRLPLIKNVDYFSKCISEIKNQNCLVPIWIEMVPIADDYIEKLISLGATGFGFNIEIWDDDLRRKICPGKVKIKKEDYFAAFYKATECLGKNRVGSCLIVGLEPIENTISGVMEISRAGVQPCLLPFKPWDGSQFSKYPPCETDVLIRASEEAVNAMIKYDIDPEANQGCLLCEGCTIDHDIYRLKRTERSYLNENRCS